MFYTCTTIVLPVVQKHSASVAKKAMKMSQATIIFVLLEMVYHFIRIQPKNTGNL